MFIENLNSIQNKIINEDTSDVYIIQSRLNKINSTYLKELLNYKHIVEERGKKTILRREAKS